MRKKLLFILFDHLLIVIAFMAVVALRGYDLQATIVRIQPWGWIFLGWHLMLALIFDKYQFRKRGQLKKTWKSLLLANFAFIGLSSIGIVWYSLGSFPRVLLFGTFAITTILELFWWTILHIFWSTKGKSFEELQAGQIDSLVSEPCFQTTTTGLASLRGQMMCASIVEELGNPACQYLKSHVPFNNHTVLLAVSNRLNVVNLPGRGLQNLINIQHVNHHRYVNKFFEAVNAKLPTGGLFAGVAETREIRKQRRLSNCLLVFGYLCYTLDYLWNRVAPKLPLFKKIYFGITSGKNRVMSRAEILGRLYSCGFDIVDEREVDGLYYFVVRKVNAPAFDPNPTYGPLIRLNRVGKDGKIIGVYKMRTMHPYSEYLQAYVHRINNLQAGGKFKNDFRISTLGRIMRMLWIDELPMIMNWIKGDLKIVGVRPLSAQYFGLYRPTLQKKRIRFKPGLVPPYYADMPKTLDEIMDSEERYLDAYAKHPWRTDFVYFWKAFYNIVFRKARSK